MELFTHAFMHLFKRATCFVHMKDIVKNQFNNHLLVEMVLRVDEFFIMRSFAFLVGFIFFNLMLHYVREIHILRNVDDGKKGEAR